MHTHEGEGVARSEKASRLRDYHPTATHRHQSNQLSDKLTPAGGRLAIKMTLQHR